MARYFLISNGLRGCYMPDSAFPIRCDTRRDLKAALQWEADSIPDAGGVGLSKRAIAALAAAAWREKPGHIYPLVAAYKWKGQDSYPYGLFVNRLTWAEYKESSDEN